MPPATATQRGVVARHGVEDSDTASVASQSTIGASREGRSDRDRGGPGAGNSAGATAIPAGRLIIDLDSDGDVEEIRRSGAGHTALGRIPARDDASSEEGDAPGPSSGCRRGVYQPASRRRTRSRAISVQERIAAVQASARLEEMNIRRQAARTTMQRRAADLVDAQDEESEDTGGDTDDTADARDPALGAVVLAQRRRPVQAAGSGARRARLLVPAPTFRRGGAGDDRQAGPAEERGRQAGEGRQRLSVTLEGDARSVIAAAAALGQHSASTSRAITNTRSNTAVARSTVTARPTGSTRTVSNVEVIIPQRRRSGAPSLSRQQSAASTQSSRVTVDLTGDSPTRANESAEEDEEPRGDMEVDDEEMENEVASQRRQDKGKARAPSTTSITTKKIKTSANNAMQERGFAGTALSGLFDPEEDVTAMFDRLHNTSAIDEDVIMGEAASLLLDEATAHPGASALSTGSSALVPSTAPAITIRWVTLPYDLEEDLSCAVCFEYMVSPSVLACQHHFCLGCIEDWFPVNNQQCPICRKASPSVEHSPLLATIIRKHLAAMHLSLEQQGRREEADQARAARQTLEVEAEAKRVAILANRNRQERVAREAQERQQEADRLQRIQQRLMLDQIRLQNDRIDAAAQLHQQHHHHHHAAQQAGMLAPFHALIQPIPNAHPAPPALAGNVAGPRRRGAAARNNPRIQVAAPAVVQVQPAHPAGGMAVRVGDIVNAARAADLPVIDYIRAMGLDLNGLAPAIAAYEARHPN